MQQTNESYLNLTNAQLSQYAGRLLTLGEQRVLKHEVRRPRAQVWDFASLIANWIRV